ncbi:acetylornithine deacetylase [Rubellimicrobium sp. CFH 75288]|nr:acetylornithine deacetylase [Rubellimicrobium sp. CFH 75288]NAZ35718.1 acetylornithine deacetylase [Rubellimicrobium sp. CFH 75288]
MLARTRDLLAELVAFPTVSEDSNLALVEHLADRLEAAGARVQILSDPTGRKANLFATIGPDRDGGFVLSGHTDVVPVADQVWTTDPFRLTERDGRLYGRGTCDMKGFVAAAVATAPLLAAARPERPVHYALTYDEEVGCLGARALADWLRQRGLRPSAALIGEPTGMRVVEGHKGCCEYSTHVAGLEGHGSDPDRGVNAVEIAARYVARLLELKEVLRARAPADSRFEPPWTTINAGALHGGQARNVIAGRARVDWEMRPVSPEDATFVKAEMARFCDGTLLPAMQAVWPGATIVTETVGEVEGLVPAAGNEARDIVMALAGATETGLVPFGTEAGIFQTMGLSAVVCGPGSIEQAHRPDEYLALDQLARCLAMLERLPARLAGGA